MSRRSGKITPETPFKYIVLSGQGQLLEQCPRSEDALHLIELLAFLAILTSCAQAAPGVSVLAPDAVDVCGAGSYKISLQGISGCTSGLSVAAEIPDGFSYAQGARATFPSYSISLEPISSGRSLTWDLGKAISERNKHVMINEFEQNPAGADSGKEWVELYNPASSSADISGWVLRENYNNKKMTMPPGTVVTSGGYLVITWSTGSDLINTQPLSISLLKNGTEVDRTISGTDSNPSTGNDLCWARYPNGQDTDSDSDWRLQASSRGSGNGGQASTPPFPDSGEIDFNLTANCGAPDGQVVSATLTYSGGSASASSHAIGINSADINVDISPDMSIVGIGVYVLWTITVSNDGNGAAYGVSVSDLPGTGLSFDADQAMSWSFDKIAAGQSEIIHMISQVRYSSGLTNQVTAAWGCCSPSQQAQSSCALTYSPSVVPGMNISFSAPSEVEIGVPSKFSITATGRFIRLPSLTSLDVAIPNGFSLSGSPTVIVQESSAALTPQVQERHLVWDLRGVQKGHLIINEFEHNPPGQDTGNEWVELYNPTPSGFYVNANVTIWENYGSGTPLYVPTGTFIPAWGYYLTNWTSGSLINSQPISLSLYVDGKEVDRTITAPAESSDDKKYYSWARYPNGFDTDNDLDWRFLKSTPGYNNRGTINYTVKVEFNLTANETAASGQTASATLAYSGTTATATSGPIAVTEPKPLSIGIFPNVSDAALGDPVSWTAVIENPGHIPVENISSRAVLGKGLKFIDADSPGGGLVWGYDELMSGDSRAVRINTQVVSLKELGVRINVSGTCAGRTSQVNASSEIESSSYMEPSLDLSVPEDMNINEIYNCSLGISGIVDDSGDAISAEIKIPSGIYYIGNARVLFQGATSSIVPEVDAGTLSCDLSDAMHYTNSVVINEIYPHPAEEGDTYEWIELYNAGSGGADVSNWYLKDAAGHNISQIKTDVVSGSAYMLPGTFLKVRSTSLNDDGDTVILFKGSSNAELDSITYPSSKAGISYACRPDGSGNWSWGTPSPCSSNGGSQISIDFSIMAGPKAASGQSIAADVFFKGILYHQSREIGINAPPVVSGNVSLSLSSPSSVYYSEPKQCTMSIKDEGARSKNMLAIVEMPPGFRISGNSTITHAGETFALNPSVSGGNPAWNLGSLLGKGRHMVINELEQSPQGGGDRWIELYNPSISDVDLSGWHLASRYGSEEWTWPELSGITIGSGEYYVVVCDSGFLPAGISADVTLYDSGGRAVDSTTSNGDEGHSDICWARYPNGLGSWASVPSSRGESNGGSCGDLAPDGMATIKFNISAGCGSVSGKNISATVTHKDGSLSTEPRKITISYGTLKINQTPDVDYVEKGDKVHWIVHIENSGSYPVHDIDVGDVPGKGIALVGITSPNGLLNWSYETIMPGQNKTFQVEALVNGTSYLYNLVEVHWGCGSKHTSKKTYTKYKRIITKTPGTDKKYAIGQQASYLLTASLPKKELSNVVMNNTFPAGLTYIPGSTTITGASIVSESKSSPADGDGTTIEWCLGDVEPSAKVKVSFNATVDNVASNQDGAVIEDKNASISFKDEDGTVTTDFDNGGAVKVIEPDLYITESSSTPKRQAKSNKTITLVVGHSPNSSAAAYDVDVSAPIPSGMRYVPGSIRILAGPGGTADDSDLTGLRWHFDEVALSKAKSKRIQLRYNVTSGDPMGDMINNATVSWSSMPGAWPGERDGSGGVNDYINGTSYGSALPRLMVSCVGSPDPVYAGDLLQYTIAYQNTGQAPANKVVIRDELDPLTTFVSSDPAPSDGNNNTWDSRCGIPDPLPPGEVHYLNITAFVNESLQNGTKLRNRFAISSDESAARTGVIYTGVMARSAIKVSKIPLRKEVVRGEDASYVIKVCNRGGLPAYNITIKDLFDSKVELVSISPAPAADGAWHVGVMNPGECFSISLTVRIPRTDIAFSMEQGISGEGFVNVAQDYSTTVKPYILMNYVTVTSDGNPTVSNSARVKVIGEPGTSLQSREHGSGRYSSDMTLKFISKNKSIQMNEDMDASYAPVAVDTPGSMPLSFSSDWSRSIYARNEAIGSSITESYRDSKLLHCMSRISMDENFSNSSISSSFQGTAHIGYLKRLETKSKPIFESTEDYDGRFGIDISTDDYGSGLAYDRSASGQGFVNINRDIHNTQKIYESGMGGYTAEETIRAYTSYIQKNLTLVRRPEETVHHQGPALGWTSGIWSKDADRTLLGEEFSEINRLNATIVAQGLTSLDTHANFSGRERFKAVKKDEIEIDQGYTGNYTLARRVLLSGASRYSYPHITVFKSGRIETVRDCTIARYKICIQNDGNRVLGPIYLRDRFPAGTVFIKSSLRPSELTSDHANWTLTHLPIGGSSTVELSLNVTDQKDMLVNIVEITGGYDDMLVCAYNLSALEFNWLGCCPPRFQAFKNATVDSDRSQAVDYSLGIKNMANTTVVAVVTDSPPAGQEVLSASEKPENISGKMVWILRDIAPGEEKVIKYDVDAPVEGTFSSTARFEVYALDGSGMSTQDESAYVVLPTGLKDGPGSAGCGTSCPVNDTEASCPCTDEGQSTTYEGSQGDIDALPYEV